MEKLTVALKNKHNFQVSRYEKKLKTVYKNVTSVGYWCICCRLIQLHFNIPSDKQRLWFFYSSGQLSWLSAAQHVTALVSSLQSISPLPIFLSPFPCPFTSSIHSSYHWPITPSSPFIPCSWTLTCSSSIIPTTGIATSRFHCFPSSPLTQFYCHLSTIPLQFIQWSDPIPAPFTSYLPYTKFWRGVRLTIKWWNAAMLSYSFTLWLLLWIIVIRLVVHWCL